ncbi:MAG TPA: glycosyltransferase [Solirubrobacteraceae bacterium]|nr:glycosyltransferase [Solirubrobacteraceae bacterium]
MSEAPDVSVLIPVLNEGAHLRETVAAMQAQELEGLTLELLFVDGASDDDTKQILEELARADPRIRVFDNPARTTAVALNIALANARGRFLARMDAHSFFPRRYLALGVERLQRGDGVEQTTGPMLPRGTGRWSRRVTLALATRLGMGGSRKWEAVAAAGSEPVEIELDTGVFAGVFRRETVIGLGGWDDGFPVNQDSELAARIIAAGGRIVCLSQMGSSYLPRDDLPALWRQYSRYGYYRAKTASRHPSSLRTSHLLPPALVLTALAALLAPRRLRRPARVGVGLYAGAVAAESARTAREAPVRVAAGMPAVFLTLHTSWGLGFLLGAARFRRLGGVLREQIARVRRQLG